MATQTTLILHHPVISLCSSRPTAAHVHRIPLRLSFSPLRKSSRSKISASISPNLKTSQIKTSCSDHDIFSDSTRTVTTLSAIAITASKFFAGELFTLAVQLRDPILSSTGPAFFAAMKEVPTGSLNTPLTVVAAGMAKWLDLYSGVLTVRILLSWFPNMPWHKQPFSAVRDLCDPYLNLFRNIIPPIYNTLDVSPLLAFSVLGVLGSILNSSRQAY